MLLPLNRRLALGAALLAVVAGAAPVSAAHAAGATRAAQAAPPAPDLQGLVQALRNTTAAGAPGAVARFTGPDGVRSETVGVRDRATGAAMNAGSRFRIGSVTKTFSAVVLLQLVSEQKVRLDSPSTAICPVCCPTTGSPCATC